MALSYVGLSGPTQASGSSVNLTPPSGFAEGDLLIYVFSTPNIALSSISDTYGTWTQCPSSPQYMGTAGDYTGVRVSAYYKYATGDEEAIYAYPAYEFIAAIMLAFRGVDSSDPFDASNGASADSATLTFPGVTTTVDNSIVILCAALSLDDYNMSGVVDSWSNPNLSGLTEVADFIRSVGGGGGIACAYGTKSSAGATGNTTATAPLGAGTPNSCLTLALNPLSAAPPETITGEAASALAWINAATIS